MPEEELARAATPGAALPPPMPCSEQVPSWVWEGLSVGSGPPVGSGKLHPRWDPGQGIATCLSGSGSGLQAPPVYPFVKSISQARWQGELLQIGNRPLLPYLRKL